MNYLLMALNLIIFGSVQAGKIHVPPKESPEPHVHHVSVQPPAPDTNQPPNIS